MVIESNLARKKCNADAQFLSGSRASCLYCLFNAVHNAGQSIKSAAFVCS